MIKGLRLCMRTLPSDTSSTLQMGKLRLADIIKFSHSSIGDDQWSGDKHRHPELRPGDKGGQEP